MPSWWSYGHTEAAVFLLGCCLTGAVLGTAVTGARIVWERRKEA
jgi:uncharacterized integral membrane protein